MNFNLKDKTAVISGVASGIGRGTSLLFAGLGAKLILLDRDQNGLEKVGEEVKAKGAVCGRYIVDVTDFEALQQTFGRISKEIGNIDIAVNCAGIWEKKLFPEMNHSDLHKMMNVNFEGYFNILKLVLPQMIEQRYGKIVCVSSVAGKVGSGVGASHYAASKGAVLAFVRSLAREMGAHNITVNAVCPGLIETPMVKSAMGRGAEDAYVKTSVLKRLGRPEEVAAVIAFLSSDLSSFVTGQAWNVCGGYLFD